MTDQERFAIMTAVKADYEAAHGPRKEWPKRIVDKFHEELGVMVHCVGILRDAGILPSKTPHA